MIPTLSGRIQSRLFLFVMLGLPITALFAYLYSGMAWNPVVAETLLLFLATITGVGLILDVVYIGLQKLRWDRDWPFAYQFFFSIVEFGIVLALAAVGLIPWLPEPVFGTLSGQMMAAMHFTSVFIPSFLALLGPISVFFIRWRFKAGQFGKL